MKAVLIDTHVFIWLVENDASLPVTIKDELEQTENVFVSVATFWEISIKVKLGKLALSCNFDDIETRFLATRFQLLSIILL